MFAYTVEGQYISSDRNIRIHDYETVIHLEEKDLRKARCIIQNVLIHPHLKKEIKNYKRWRTCEVFEGELVEKAPEGVETDGELERLALEASENGVIPVTINENVSSKGKKKALKDAVEKNKLAKARQAKKNGKKSSGKLEDAD